MQNSWRPLKNKTNAAMSAMPSLRVDSVLANDSTMPALGDCVARSLRSYLRNAGEQTACDLYRLVMSEVEAPLLREALRHTDGNLSRAAELLGISRATLRKKLTEYGFE